MFWTDHRIWRGEVQSFQRLPAKVLLQGKRRRIPFRVDSRTSKQKPSTIASRSLVSTLDIEEPFEALRSLWRKQNRVSQRSKMGKWSTKTTLRALLRLVLVQQMWKLPQCSRTQCLRRCKDSCSETIVCWHRRRTFCNSFGHRSMQWWYPSLHRKPSW